MDMEKTGQAKEEKHVGFNQAIIILEAEIENLGVLADRIRGGGHSPSGEPKATVEAPICLGDFLESGQERITGLTARLKEYRQELRKFLF